MVTTEDFSRPEGFHRPVAASRPVDFGRTVLSGRTGTSCDSGDSGFVVEQITVGAHANGFGRNADGRQFTFRVHKSTLSVEIYREDLLEQVPDKSDVIAVVEQPVTEIDVTDERSIVAAVRDAVTDADELIPGSPELSRVRSCLQRVGSILDRIRTRQNVTA